MGSLIALSENPYNIKKLFINTDYNNKGLYGVWLCESGNWKLILLDHYIPCFNNRPCYARSKNNELWVMLLEKAYAKAYLGYKNIVLGFSGDALKDLTGAPSEYIDLKEDFAWNLMVSAREKNFVLCVSTKSNKDLDSELISKHNYAILYLKAINNKELWLKLQNPLQGFSWKSDIKPNPEIEKALDYNEKDEKKGIFLINFKDFKENFEVVTCNKIHSDYYYSFVKIKENNKDNTSIIKAIVLEKTHCYISIHQKHERFFKGNKNKDYSYSVSRVIVCKIEENMIKKVLIGDFSTKQTTFVEVSLEIGEYLIYAEVDFLGDKYFERTISVYSSLPVVLDLIEKNTIEMKDTEILEEIFKIYLIENPKFAQITDYESSGLKKYNGTLWGFVYFWYKNDNKNVDLYEAVTLTKCENLFKFLPLNAKNNNYFEVVCKANDFRLVLYKIGSYSNGSHACTMSSLINLNENLDDKSLIELALLNGTKNKRTNEITLISYKFKGGTALVYQNKGKTSFAENLTFKILENIEIILQNGVLAKASNVAVKVTPNGYFLIRLNIKNPFIKKSGFNYSVI